MRIDVVAPQDLSPEDVAAWEALQGAHSAFASPYLSPQWTLACAGVDGPDRRGGRVLVVRKGARAAGFLPVRLAGTAALPIGAPLCDYQALVADPDLELDPRTLVRALPAARFDFNNLLDSYGLFRPFVRGGADSQIIDLSDGYDAYAALRRAEGHEILKDTAKKRRKLEREHGAVEFRAMSTDVDDFEQLIDMKRRQYRATRQTDIFEAGWPLELLRSLLARRDPRFCGALFTLHVGGVMVAAHFALRSERVLHAWFIAHDPEFARYSPGVALIEQIMRWGVANGIHEIDLGPGDYRFKFQLANATRRVTHGFVGTPSASALVREAQYRVRTAAEALPLGRVSAWPGKAMRRVDLWRGLR